MLPAVKGRKRTFDFRPLCWLLRGNRKACHLYFHTGKYDQAEKEAAAQRVTLRGGLLLNTEYDTDPR